MSDEYFDLDIPIGSSSSSPRFSSQLFSTFDPPDPFCNGTSANLYEHAPLPVEILGLPELMKNPHVQAMYKDFRTASSQVTQAISVQHALFEENKRLSAEIAMLKSGRKEFRANQLVKESLSRSVSISPSDSASQLATQSASAPAPVLHQPATRPTQYPKNILWTLDDCQSDPVMMIKESNKCRPTMEQAIRHPDGTGITGAEWRAIKVSAQYIIRKDLSGPKLAHPTDPAALAKPRIKTYYRTYFPTEYTNALVALEQLQPLVALCAAHWKADHIIGGSLRAISDEKTRKEKERKKQQQQERRTKASNSDMVSGSDNTQPQKTSLGKRRKRSSSTTKAFHDNDFDSDTSLNIDINMNTINDNKNNDGNASDNVGKIGNKNKRRKHHKGSPSREKGKNKGKKEGSSSLGYLKATANCFQGPQLGILGTASTLGCDSDAVDTSFIQVDVSFTNLKLIFQRDFPSVPYAVELLNAMQANVDFKRGLPSTDMDAFMSRIESADPNSPEFSEDNTNISWGHKQFTSGSLTARAVLRAWEDVGSTDMACKLIALTIKTCKVARHLCFERKIDAGSFLSDAYLQNIVELLWELWRNASDSTAVADPASNASAISQQPILPRSSDNPMNPDNDEHVVPDKTLRALLQAIYKEELKNWIRENGGVESSKVQSKEALINGIVNDPRVRKPTQEDIKGIIAMRKSKKKTTASSSAS